ncbi:MAG: membrane protein insertion efficiency factor YidD [Planctomycetes bacterium]|nr:membrane protein insertion efficiency factor YidD [Planctomycetota bacterium]
MKHLPRRLAALLLSGYKMLISPLLPRACRFHPTCSEYCREAILRHGVLRGGWMGIWRLLRCQPLAKGGFDPVPEATARRRAPPTGERSGQSAQRCTSSS